MVLNSVKGLGSDAGYYWTVISKGYSSFGSFSPAEPDVRFLKDGRNVMLLVDLVYTDPDGVKWSVPKGQDGGSVFNGASIPAIFWNTVGSPWTGQYRNASLVHDYYCQNHLRPWRDVHRMFYYGCLAGGVRPSRAKIMFAAVFAQGPRWEYRQPDGSTSETWRPSVAGSQVPPVRHPELLESLKPADERGLKEAKPSGDVENWVPNISSEQVSDINRWIHKNSPSIQNIEDEIDRRFR